MKQKILLDTGTLVAVLSKRDSYHEWSKQAWGEIAAPFLTCEAVITEACFILQDVYGGEETLLQLLEQRTLIIPFRLDEESPRIRELMTRYQSVPMSLADACLVRMSELIQGSTILTLDSDFRIYRKNGKESIEVIMPDPT
jgi:uncharacterized protein